MSSRLYKVVQEHIEYLDAMADGENDFTDALAHLVSSLRAAREDD